MSDAQKLSRDQGVRAAATRIVTDSTYSSKGHFNAADGFRKARLGLGGSAAALAAIASAGTLAPGLVPGWVIGTAAIVAAAVGTFVTLYDPGGKASHHERLGSDYLALKKDTQLFIDVGLATPPTGPTYSSEKLAALVDRQRAVDKEGSSYPIPRWAYARAREGVRRGEAKY